MSAEWEVEKVNCSRSAGRTFEIVGWISLFYAYR